MKNNVTDGLNKVFEVGTDLVEVDKEKKQADVPQDVDNDYKYARENLYGVIEKGTDALDSLLDLAKASEHPRACLLYTSPSPRDNRVSRMPSSA